MSIAAEGFSIATAHSIYLNTAAELGLLGLVVGGWLMVALILAWWRRWQQARRSSQAEQIRLVAVGAALVGLTAQTLVDTYTATPNMLVMHPSVPVGSVKELIALAKAKPNQLNYASTGNGTSNHMSMELF